MLLRELLDFAGAVAVVGVFGATPFTGVVASRPLFIMARLGRSDVVDADLVRFVDVLCECARNQYPG